MSSFSKLRAEPSRSAALPGTPAQPSLVGGPSWRIVLTQIGVGSPTCPYCGYQFEKMPQRKRACPTCGCILYSRKRAVDGTKVLLTEAEARVGEGQDALLALVREEGPSDVDLDALVRELHVQLARMPTADEVVVEYLERVAAAHAESWNWGLYRNARFKLAESCARRGLPKEALWLMLEVSLVDLNGPRNLGSRDPALARRYPPFDPSKALLAPGVIRRTGDLIAELRLSPEDTRGVFEAVANAVGPPLNLPRSAAEAWQELSLALAQVQG